MRRIIIALTILLAAAAPLPAMAATSASIIGPSIIMEAKGGHGGGHGSGHGFGGHGTGRGDHGESGRSTRGEDGSGTGEDTRDRTGGDGDGTYRDTTGHVIPYRTGGNGIHQCDADLDGTYTTAECRDMPRTRGGRQVDTWVSILLGIGVIGLIGLILGIFRPIRP